MTLENRQSNPFLGSLFNEHTCMVVKVHDVEKVVVKSVLVSSKSHCLFIEDITQACGSAQQSSSLGVY
jgi:hypothetical protein